ncbi:MAG: FHA domain-containing protein [Planctomycetota bacterium]|nr:MAG: FHA domain-containing protein [Planctomycetota bacterium]
MRAGAGCYLPCSERGATPPHAVETAVASLIMIAGKKHRVVPLTGERVTVGRAPDNTVQIEDAASSRRHCEFVRDGAGWRVRDLRSLNGTFVNDLSVGEHALRAGDRVQVGATSFYFVPSPQGADEEPETTVRFHAAPSDEARAASRKLRNFAALLEISKAVAAELEPGRLLTLVIDKSMELTGAERGFLILLDDNGQARFEVARDREGRPIDEPEHCISRSVLERVTTRGEPVVTVNAQNDLGAFVSIVALEVRSLLCVPLVMHNRVAGAIYVDSQVASREFDDESLNLLHAFADQVSVALTNARLYQEALEAREREERVRRIFQKYVPADVVRRVLSMSEDERLSAKLEATVLFSDIRSFTSLSERLPPEEVVAFLNDYLQRMVRIVDEAGGIVDKFIGDAIMAVFGAPAPRPDDARRAVRAALAMLAEIERFNEEQRRRGGVRIEVGIGIHTGSVIAGNMGSDKKMEYTVIGDTVNAACRIEALTKDLGYPLLVSRACLTEAGPEHFRTLAFPPVHVKGKAQPILVHAVLATADEPAAPPTSSALPTPPAVPAPPTPGAAGKAGPQQGTVRVSPQELLGSDG